MDREVCYVYSFYSLDLENTINSDLVYHDCMNEYLAYLDKRFKKTFNGMRRINVIHRNKNSMVTEDNFDNIKDLNNMKVF